VIASGGYGTGLIEATGRYIDLLLDDSGAERPLREVVDMIGSDDLHYYAPYEQVHTQNLAAVARVRGPA
jgi:hypothetical protein